MQRRIFLIIMVLSFSCTLSPVPCPLAYALEEAKEEKGKSGLTEILQTVNQRLKTQIERLSELNESLNSEKMKLRGELNKIARDREEIFDKLKIFTDENSKLKDQISYLQTGVVNLDDARKALEEANKTFSEKIVELEKGVQPVKEVREELNKYKDKSGQLEKEIKKLQDTIITIGKLEKKKDRYVKGKAKPQEDLKDRLIESFRTNKESERLKREVADTHYNLGVTFQEANKWERAIIEYERVLEVKPDDADAHFNLALIYETVKNDRDRALYHYEKYLGANPGAEDASKVKGYITDLDTKKAVWGEPRRKGIKEELGRW